MSAWRTFMRFLLTCCILFVLVIGFSLLTIDTNTRAGQEALVVSVMALVPALLTIVGVLVVISVDWDPF